MEQEAVYFGENGIIKVTIIILMKYEDHEYYEDYYI